MSDLREALEAERAELIAENEAATSWGAAVGARSERIREIDSALAALSAQPRPEAAYTLDQVVSLFYKNHRGEIALRSFVPKSVRFGSTEWHPEPQWLLLAWDADKRADREFALKDFGPQPDAVEAVKELATRERFSQAALARIRKVRDEYANQAKFADVEPASYLREFIRRLDRAVDQKQSSPPWNGGAAPPLAPDARLRRALELWLDVEIAYASDMQREMYRSGKDRLGDNYHGRHTALLEGKQKVEALSRADDASNASAEARLLTGSLAKDVAAAAKRVSEWSAAKQDYARRAMGAGADEGKKSESAIAGPLNLDSEMLRRDALLDRPSDPTPAEQRITLDDALRVSLTELKTRAGG